jgi:hypothetical protein
VEDVQISTSNVKMTFDSAAALASVIDQISFTIDDNMIGLLHPSEVMEVARSAIFCAFKTIIDDMGRPEVQKHLECALIVKSRLSKMINKELIETKAGIVKH